MGNKLTPQQQRDIEAARQLLHVADLGTAALAAGVLAHDAGNPYPEAFGAAYVRMEALLDIIDGLTGGDT